MKKSKRLIPVRQIKEREERDAAVRLGDAQQGLNAAIKQLDELKQYRQDYYSSLSSGLSTGAPGDPKSQSVGQPRIQSSVPATVLEKYQLFLAKLNSVVERQQETVEQYRQHVEAHRQKWLEADARLKSIDHLIDRAKEEEELLLDKQEQKLADERSQYPKRLW